MSRAPSGLLAERHRRLRAALRADDLGALVVTALPNITYLTNFTGTSAIVVLTDDAVHFLTDSRYVTAIEDAQRDASACPELSLTLVDGAYDAALAALLRRMAPRRAGIEAQHLTVARFAWLERTLSGAPAPALVPTEGLVEQLRVVKDAYEIDRLRVGGRMISDVARQVFHEVRRGRAERDIAFSIDRLIREAGFSKSAFETIVASGPNAALPHARPTGRTIDEGDLVVLDFGGVYDSYCVDLTRTVSVGTPSPRSREVHSAVREAHDRAVAAVAPGVSRFAIDAAAREALTAAGMGEAFGHGTGHGLGLEIHEDPRVTRWRPDVDARGERLDTGMVFTIEPGAYFPAWGGVRIENDVLVTGAGGELLTDVTTELLDIDAWT
jgi:Xaa-Pro aminopeptidase